MVDGGLNGERLSEVSRLAGVLADQVLRESMEGETSLAKLTALGKAALLLQDYDRPIPDPVVDVLSRALRSTEEDGAEAGEVHEAEAALGAEKGAGEAGAMQEAEDTEAPRRLFPRLIQSLRPLRG
ncbi:hypothetical protein NBEOAGPD_1568 [Methylobacterium gregans]|uniref:Uncharacterized protein n=2 Tax=Methylobacterium gregans TaxID=374424 RepID=A0AA37HMQ2_9HYPH|nr:hypothetical protein NBEOAGPD_1568 [Methylobacterium gregans]